MKHSIGLLFVIVLLSSFLAGCGSIFRANTDNCLDGVCLDLEIEEPLVLYQPKICTITVTTDLDIQNLEVALGVSGPIQHVLLDVPAGAQYYEDSGSNQALQWFVDTQANVPLEPTATVTFLDDGGYGIHYDAYRSTMSRRLDGHYVKLRFIDSVGEINPTFREDFDFAHAPDSPTPIPTPGPPPGWKRVQYIEPEETVELCNWDIQDVSLWRVDEAKLWIEIPEIATKDMPMSAQIGVELPETQQGKIIVNLELCQPKEAFVSSSDQDPVWQFEGEPGEIVTKDIELLFT